MISQNDAASDILKNKYVTETQKEKKEKKGKNRRKKKEKRGSEPKTRLQKEIRHTPPLNV